MSKTANMAMFYIVMGVAGSGKTTIGKLLAERLHIPFYDGDDFHPAENKAKMAAGIPLEDIDRAGWLDAMRSMMADALSSGQSGVLACSALKEKYRIVLAQAGRVKFIYLKGGFKQIEARLKARKGHYMKADMLQSQFDALEEPTNALTVKIENSLGLILEEIMRNITNDKPVIGLMGMGVMGRNLARNLASHGFSVVGYNRTLKAEMAQESFPVYTDLSTFLAKLDSPKIIWLMIAAGKPVDDVIESLLPGLSCGDILIDGGNSHYLDTARRARWLQTKGIRYLGMGVSGGEEGALHGPSLMPGGDETAWPILQPMLEAIAAKASDHLPCVSWIGEGGAGHFVKMVHNGIEYAEMQAIAEIYDLLHRGANRSNKEIAKEFNLWNNGVLQSFLLEISHKILFKQDTQSGNPLVEMILDEAGQKGTGRWASETALLLGSPVPGISASVDARYLSSLKAERIQAAKKFPSLKTDPGPDKRLYESAQTALFCTRIISYAQGLALIDEASKVYSWNLDISSILRLWRAGCIIRSRLLDQMADSMSENAKSNLIMTPYFAKVLLDNQSVWREFLMTGIKLGIPLPVISANLAYFDGYRSERLPANLIQAQRDFFGAHTYRRVDREGSFHTNWDN